VGGQDRAEASQQFLGRRRDDSGRLGEAPPLIGVLGEIGEAALQCARHGVEAGQEKEEEDVDRLRPGEPPSFVLRVLKSGHAVLAGLSGPLIESVGAVVVEVPACLPPLRFLLSGRRRLRVVQLPLQGENGRKVLLGKAENLQQHGSRKVQGKLLAQVGAASIDEAVDQRAGVLFHERDRFFATAAEHRVDRVARELLLGRVELQRAERTDVAEPQKGRLGGKLLGASEHGSSS
jgi:hypothetical protein